MMQLPEGFDSIFRYIVVVSQRAEQLIGGARPRAESRRRKPTLVARDDVDAGTVTWRILTQEEIDAQRQAIVDQFRAEVGAEEAGERRAPIPDVLPTGVRAAEEPPVAAGGERDDEIARLQRLLGMAGARDLDEDETDEDESDGDDAGGGDGDLALDLDEDYDESGDDSGSGDGDGDEDDDY